jgi:membrane protease YdiL (CAAX protease family)
LAGLVLGASFLFFAWLHITIPRLERVSAPEQALALMVGRTFDLEEALPHAPVWERLLYELSMESGADTLQEAIEWYRELAGYSKDPVVALHLAILEGEAGQLDHLRAKVARWERDSGPLDSYAVWVRTAYLELALPLTAERQMQAELAETLEAGWFYDKLALRLASRAGDRPLVAATSDALLRRGRELLERLRGLLMSDLAFVLVGVITAGALLQRPDHGRWRIGTAVIPPHWRGSTGMAVLIWGGAIGSVLTLVYLFEDISDSLLRFAALPLVNLPLLLLARRHLMTPFGLDLTEGLGLRMLPLAWGRFGLVCSALLAVGFAGEWLIAMLAESIGWSSHWTEWFDNDLVWGDSSEAAGTLVEYVLFAPVFEEVAFRGLLFATLRRRFGMTASALISAAVFGAAHGYGLLGFVSVLWSGLLWAWAYEKTGSLLPGILAHAVNNLLVCLAVILLLRW